MPCSDRIGERRDEMTSIIAEPLLKAHRLIVDGGRPIRILSDSRQQGWLDIGLFPLTSHHVPHRLRARRADDIIDSRITAGYNWQEHR